jgi:GT2 family glycosyltransferase
LNNNYIQKEFLNIILLNYNGSADTIECLNSILTSDYVNFEITIVDNNSTPNDILILNQYILHKYNNYYIYDYDSHVFNLTNKKVILKTEPRINLIKLKKNFGFANGNNIGIDFGRNRSHKYYFFLNNDTIILNNSISILMKHLLENKTYHAFIPQIRFYEERDKIWNCGGKMKFYGKCKYLFSNQIIDKICLLPFYEVNFVTGCALLINYEKTGKFSSNYFFGEEDYDFSIRQKKNNIKMLCITSSIIFHKVNSTINKAGSKNISRFYYYYLCRLLNFKLNFSGIYKYFLFSLVIIKIIYDSLLLYSLNFIKTVNNVKFLFNTLKQNDQIDENLFKYYLKIHKWN